MYFWPDTSDHSILETQTVPLTLLLLSAAALNALYVFTRTRIYRLHSRKDPVASPHVKFVAAHMDFEPLEPPSMFQRLSAGWSVSWRFLLNLSQPERTENNIQRVQQLEVWDAGAMETELLCVYSPVQSLLWMSTNTHNWMLMLLVMVLSGSLVRRPLLGLFTQSQKCTAELHYTLFRGVDQRQRDYIGRSYERIQRRSKSCLRYCPVLQLIMHRSSYTLA